MTRDGCRRRASAGHFHALGNVSGGVGVSCRRFRGDDAYRLDARLPVGASEIGYNKIR